jgi:hypothetical protein
VTRSIRIQGVCDSDPQPSGSGRGFRDGHSLAIICGLLRNTPVHGVYESDPQPSGSGRGFRDGHSLAIICGLLRNSTIFAAQKSGLGQSSQRTPSDDGKRKRGLIVSETPT